MKWAFLTTEADNRNLLDTTKVYFNDELALGHINDPEFGSTHADAYFNISHPNYFFYPYYNRDSVKMDSVKIDSVKKVEDTLIPLKINLGHHWKYANLLLDKNYVNRVESIFVFFQNIGSLFWAYLDWKH